MFDKIMCSTYGFSRIPEKERKDGLFYFELRTPDNGKDSIIEDFVYVNNEGCLVADRDILQDGIDCGLIDSRDEGIYLFEELSSIYKIVEID